MIQHLRNEIWKEMTSPEWKDNEHYKVSNYGRVLSYKNDPEGKLIKTTITNGYEAFTVRKKNNKNHLVYIHRAIAMLFIDNPDEKRFVIHLDFDKTGNWLKNLDWATRQELNAHNKKNPAVIIAKEKIKAKRPYAKLSVAKVKLIKRKLFEPNRKTKLKRIAKQFGISEMQLWRIQSGENWGDITDY